LALQEPSEAEEDTPPARVRILAFASEDCHQCHILQAPVLRRVKEAHGDIVTIIDIDASNTPELTSRYHVLTVPTTVLLDVKGKAHAVNYGFTNAQSLLKQVDEILVLDDVSESAFIIVTALLFTDICPFFPLEKNSLISYALNKGYNLLAS
jgi:hypothetical protein